MTCNHLKTKGKFINIHRTTWFLLDMWQSQIKLLSRDAPFPPLRIENRQIDYHALTSLHCLHPGCGRNGFGIMEDTLRSYCKFEDFLSEVAFLSCLSQCITQVPDLCIYVLTRPREYLAKLKDILQLNDMGEDFKNYDVQSFNKKRR